MGNFGTRLEEYRIFKKIPTQDDFAKVFGCDQKNMTSWKKGSIPKAATIEKILSSYPDLSREYLLHGIPPMIKSVLKDDTDTLKKENAELKAEIKKLTNELLELYRLKFSSTTGQPNGG